MGKRYKAILKFLGKQFYAADKEISRKDYLNIAKNSTGVIIATPTETHEEIIRDMMPVKIPILCEKPVGMNISKLNDLIYDMQKSGTSFRMMFQYSHLIDKNRIGKTRYDYFRHGKDGLVWDCLQIIGLARGEVTLLEDSPVWSCVINGQTVDISHMDAAYVHYVQKWFSSPAQDLGFIQAIHEKVSDMAKEAKFK